MLSRFVYVHLIRTHNHQHFPDGKTCALNIGTSSGGRITKIYMPKLYPAQSLVDKQGAGFTSVKPNRLAARLSRSICSSFKRRLTTCVLRFLQYSRLRHSWPASRKYRVCNFCNYCNSQLQTERFPQCSVYFSRQCYLLLLSTPDNVLNEQRRRCMIEGGSLFACALLICLSPFRIFDTVPLSPIISQRSFARCPLASIRCLSV